jgi:hypothetical protein
MAGIKDLSPDALLKYFKLNGRTAEGWHPSVKTQIEGVRSEVKQTTPIIAFNLGVFRDRFCNQNGNLRRLRHSIARPKV